MFSMNSIVFLFISPCSESRGVISNSGASPEWLLGLRVSDSARLQRYDLRHLWCCSQTGDCTAIHEQRTGAEECGGERLMQEDWPKIVMFYLHAPCCSDLSTCLHTFRSVHSLPGLSFRSQMRCTWMTSG